MRLFYCKIWQLLRNKISNKTWGNKRVSLLKQVVFRLFGKRFVSVRCCNVSDVLFQWDLFGRLYVIYVKSSNWFLPKLLFCIQLNLKVSFIRGWGVKVTHLNKCIQKKFFDIYERFKNLVSSALRKFAMDVFISTKLFIIHQWSRFYTNLWQECHSDCSAVFYSRRTIKWDLFGF